MKKKLQCIVMAFVLLMAAVITPMTVQAHALSNNIHEILFDATYYANTYADLKKAFGYNSSKLYQHYQQYGKQEGRAPSVLFVPQYYVGIYPDLKNAFGNNWTAAYNHFVTYGIKEGRKGSPNFDVTVYKENYEDLRNAFGTSSSDNWKYLKHYREFGISESRNAVSKISSGSSSGSKSYQAYVKTNGNNRLNVRSSASTSASVVAQLPNGSSVTVLQEVNATWANISFSGGSGFVSRQYLTTTAPSSAPSGSTEAQKITARLNAMQNGTYGSGAYKVGTKYTGAYANEQCKGFAKKIHMDLFGYNIGSTKAKPNNYQISIGGNSRLVGSLTNLSGKANSSVQSLFAGARPGDFIQVRRSHGGSHSMIFMSSNSSGVTVYECNVDGCNGIQTATYSWSQFRSSNQAVSVYTAVNYYLH